MADDGSSFVARSGLLSLVDLVDELAFFVGKSRIS